MRHYRAPRRPVSTWSSQSERTGGLVDKGGQVVQQKHSETGRGLGLRYLPVGHPQQKQGQVESVAASKHLPDPVQLSNLFGLLGKLGSQEFPAH